MKKGLIYHYCTMETFMAIIKNKTIRLSDLNKTNDYMEKTWTNRFIVDVLKEKLIEYSIDMNLEEDYWYDDEANNHLEYYKKEIRSILYNETPTLITCFSEEKDKLSQWRGYGDDGKGVSIGFNKKAIKLLTKNKNIKLEKVIYNEKDQKQRLGELIESVIIYIQEMFKNDLVKVSDNFNEYFIEEFDTFCEVLIDDIEQVSCTIKNPAFAEEKEIRIIYNPHMHDRKVLGDIEFAESEIYFSQEKHIKDYKINPLSFNYRNNQLIAFCDIDFSKMICEELINEIIIGPKSRLRENDIYYFLLSNGFDANRIEISKSDSTYR